MPIKQHLTKYDMLAYKIRKLAAKGAVFKNGKAKNSEAFYTADERDIITKAVIVAAFASGHSWQTNKCITNANGSQTINGADILRESTEAADTKWKMVSNLDISEVSKINLPDSSFSAWVYFNIDRSQHDHYKRVWNDFKEEFKDDCEYDEAKDRV